MRSLAFVAALLVSASAQAQDQPPGRPGWPCAGRPDPTYVKTAEATGGQLFMFHPSEVAESGALVAASFSHRETLFRTAGPVEDEHVAAPVDVDAGDFAELHARRQARPVLDFQIPGRRCAVGPSALLGAGQPGGERDDD